MVQTGIRICLAAIVAVVLAACADPQPSMSTSGFDQLLNKERSKRDLPTVTQSSLLTKAAQMHANDMAARVYFSHISPEGYRPENRADAVGYDHCFIVENIAKGQPDQSAAFKSWMKSRGHRENMLSPYARQYGLASGPGNIWVLMLGRPCGG